MTIFWITSNNTNPWCPLLFGYHLVGMWRLSRIELPHSLFLTVSTWKMTLTLRLNFFEQLLSKINTSMWTLAHPRPHSLLQESDHLSGQPVAHQHLESEISRGHSPTITQRVSNFQPVVSVFHGCWVPGPAQNEQKWLGLSSTSQGLGLLRVNWVSSREVDQLI